VLERLRFAAANLRAGATVAYEANAKRALQVISAAGVRNTPVSVRIALPPGTVETGLDQTHAPQPTPLVSTKPKS
jgi:hypothetical protein